jgi:hypothetical protein
MSILDELLKLEIETDDAAVKAAYEKIFAELDWKPIMAKYLMDQHLYGGQLHDMRERPPGYVYRNATTGLEV